MMFDNSIEWNGGNMYEDMCLLFLCQYGLAYSIPLTYGKGTGDIKAEAVRGTGYATRF